MEDLDKILDLVKSYAEKNLLNKKWEAGKDYVSYAGPYFDSSEYTATISSLLKGWLGLGESGLKFEHKFSQFMGKEFGVLTNSGSSANLLMMSALTSRRGYNFPKGTKVLMPIAGFPTTLNPTLQVGFTPIFIDIELDTLNLDLTKAEELIKKHDVKVITFAHALGNPPNMEKVMYLVEKYNLVLLEDCCDALGSTYDGKLLGSFGAMSSCSFYPAHHITLGEGGFVACDTKHQEIIVKSFREWGRGCYCSGPKANTLKNGTCKKRFSNWIPALSDEVFDHKYVYDEIGFNIKPLELQAAMGLEQIKKIPEITEKRISNYNALYSLYEPYEEYFHIPRATENSNPSWFAFPLTVRETAPFTRGDIVEFFEDNLIQTRPYFAGNIMLQPAYSHLVDAEQISKEFPMATFAMKQTYFHGTSPVITKEQIEYIKECLDNFMKKV